MSWQKLKELVEADSKNNPAIDAANTLKGGTRPFNKATYCYKIRREECIIVVGGLRTIEIYSDFTVCVHRGFVKVGKDFFEVLQQRIESYVM